MMITIDTKNTISLYKIGEYQQINPSLRRNELIQLIGNDRCKDYNWFSWLKDNAIEFNFDIGGALGLTIILNTIYLNFVSNDDALWFKMVWGTVLEGSREYQKYR